MVPEVLVLLVGIGCRPTLPPDAAPTPILSSGPPLPAPAVEPEAYRARAWSGPSPSALHDNWVDIATASGEQGKRMCHALLERELSRSRALGWSIQVARICSLEPLAPAAPTPGLYWLAQTVQTNPDAASGFAMQGGTKPPQQAESEVLVLQPSHRFSVFPSKAACERARERLSAAQKNGAEQDHANAVRWLEEQSSRNEQRADEACAEAEASASRCDAMEQSHARAACSSKNQSNRCTEQRFNLTICRFERERSQRACEMERSFAQTIREKMRTMDLWKYSNPEPECRPSPR
jgi:hypothetical protein